MTIRLETKVAKRKVHEAALVVAKVYETKLKSISSESGGRELEELHFCVNEFLRSVKPPTELDILEDRRAELLRRQAHLETEEIRISGDRESITHQLREVQDAIFRFYEKRV